MLRKGRCPHYNPVAPLRCPLVGSTASESEISSPSPNGERSAPSQPAVGRDQRDVIWPRHRIVAHLFDEAGGAAHQKLMAGRTIISQRIAITAAKAGIPKANHQRKRVK